MMNDGITVTLLTAAVTGQDAYLNDVYSFTSSDVGPCAWVPGATSEATEGTEQVISDGELYLPPGTAIKALDQVIILGVQYEVTGKPNAWFSPFTGVASPVMARVRLVTGAAAHSAATTGGA
jgi:hypothetical protein